MSKRSPTSSSEILAPANACAGMAQTFAIQGDALGSRIDSSIVLWVVAAGKGTAAPDLVHGFPGAIDRSERKTARRLARRTR
jgi:hypothetical protein